MPVYFNYLYIVTKTIQRGVFMTASKNDVSRIIIEIPKEKHRKLKSKAALLGKSMKDLILESLDATYGSDSNSQLERRDIKK
jgi:hypothetical protein